MGNEPVATLLVRVPGNVDVGRTLSLLAYGYGDPAFRRTPAGIWRGIQTPDGAGAVRISVVARTLTAQAWGPGAEWLIAAVPAMCGFEDDVSSFRPDHELISRLHRQYPGLRFPRTGLVMESLVPAILSQKITGKEAFSSWRQLVRRFGARAPEGAPADLFIPPDALRIARLEDWQWHAVGVDRAHRATIRRVAAIAPTLERLTVRPSIGAMTAMQSIPGVGVWTASEVAQRTFGDADAPSFSDYHIPGHVGLALAGSPGDDEMMARLLEPFRPHRGRVVRLLELGFPRRERHGPRRTVPNYRSI
ncbi:MAG: DNA-3-methyladenine glycosylase 2 family protein [Antricoccus sp.]